MLLKKERHEEETQFEEKMHLIKVAITYRHYKKKAMKNLLREVPTKEKGCYLACPSPPSHPHQPARGQFGDLGCRAKDGEA